MVKLLKDVFEDIFHIQEGNCHKHDENALLWIFDIAAKGQSREKLAVVLCDGFGKHVHMLRDVLLGHRWSICNRWVCTFGQLERQVCLFILGWFQLVSCLIEWGVNSYVTGFFSRPINFDAFCGASESTFWFPGQPLITEPLITNYDPLLIKMTNL